MLPDGFVFSQSSLQDYVDCPRRFQLRYLEHCRWPAPETADALEFERLMQAGHAFHRLMRQLYSGVSPDLLEPIAATDADLRHWWANYRATPPPDLPRDVQEAEVTLATTLCAECAMPRCFRLEARYDLLTGTRGGSWTIVDWKTGQKRPRRAWLENRLQTRIYPFVLVHGGATFNGGQPIMPESVEMLYWFAEFPAQPERFAYSAPALAADEAYLQGLLAEITVKSGEFPKTPDRRICRFCVYRSLCWEDVQAGRLAEAEDVEVGAADLEDLDLEAIAPIPF